MEEEDDQEIVMGLDGGSAGGGVGREKVAERRMNDYKLKIVRC